MYRIMVSPTHEKITVTDIEQGFKRFGQVLSVTLHSGFSYVDYENEIEATCAVASFRAVDLPMAHKPLVKMIGSPLPLDERGLRVSSRMNDWFYGEQHIQNGQIFRLQNLRNDSKILSCRMAIPLVKEDKTEKCQVCKHEFVTAVRHHCEREKTGATKF